MRQTPGTGGAGPHTGAAEDALPCVRRCPLFGHGDCFLGARLCALSAEDAEVFGALKGCAQGDLVPVGELAGHVNGGHLSNYRGESQLPDLAVAKNGRIGSRASFWRKQPVQLRLQLHGDQLAYSQFPTGLSHLDH